MNNIFDAKDVHEYLGSRLEDTETSRRGIKSAFANAIGCDGAYVSRLLKGAVRLSLEQGMRANRFFNHTADESEYFLLQIGRDRAGTSELCDYYQKRLDAMKVQHLTLSKRVEHTESLPELTQAKYYSHWLYAALDIATSVPELQSPEALSRYFGVSTDTVMTALTFLLECGVVERKNGKWVNTNRPFYLKSDSPLIRTHHTNWRLKAIQMLEQPDRRKLHYSSVISISVRDFERLKELLIQAINEARDIVKPSKDEMIAVYNIDCFELKT
ncbi:MAG: DUF4423 domain-containing protein [Proteobacteria bacterium]|nr:DUF4423 domain-containing protein [Pseudomonadota bacterium]